MLQTRRCNPLDFIANSVDVNERYQPEQCHMWDDAGIITKWTSVEDPVKLADFCQLS